MSSISFPRDPTCTLFKLQRELTGSKSDISPDSHFPFANRCRYYTQQSMYHLPVKGFFDAAYIFFYYNKLQDRIYSVYLNPASSRAQEIKSIYTLYGPSIFC